ncbi:hypothetical protein SASPL_126395 [Salvia splendens]|uniref:Secreted protein n=1 Tax=Salvia splendens TaxID=180675 RepID=A0A8X8ZR39_SALSN|nr:hypothetical protein SASPL_126395 [Salvia splendens]
MAVGWSVTLWMARMVWFAWSGWVISCLTVADELAGSLRSGDIGPFHVGKMVETILLIIQNLALTAKSNHAVQKPLVFFAYPIRSICESSAFSCDSLLVTMKLSVRRVAVVVSIDEKRGTRLKSPRVVLLEKMEDLVLLAT